MELVFEN